MAEEDQEILPREISFLQQQQLFFRRAINHFTNPDVYLYTGQSRDQIPDDVLHVRVDPSVRIIDWDTFAGCSMMRTIELPHGLLKILGRAFIDCYKLNDPKIPTTVKEIGDMAFSSCLAMNSLDLPDGLERIGRAAFPSCSFRNVKLPRTLNEVGDQSFSACTDLVSAEIPYGVTAIQAGAFFQCLELRNVAIPETVNVIGEGAFECCFKLEDLFPEMENLIEALKTRFDDLPMHKICYYQAHHSTEATLQVVSQALKKMNAALGDARIETMGQDCFGMTPLHILAMSKKQDLAVYKLLVKACPEDINVTDSWGYLPVYYACLCDAPLEVIQYLLDCHQRQSDNAVEELPWKTIVDDFSIMFVSSKIMKCVVFWTIADRLHHRVQYQLWREDIVNAIRIIPGGGRKTWREKEKQVNAVYDLLNLYELKEMTSLLELAAWKSKLVQSQGVKKRMSVAATDVHSADELKGDVMKRRLSNATHATQTTHMSSEAADTSERGSIISSTVMGESTESQPREELETAQTETNPEEAMEIRNNCRINSGAELIISNVMPYCLHPVMFEP